MAHIEITLTNGPAPLVERRELKSKFIIGRGKDLDAKGGFKAAHGDDSVATEHCAIWMEKGLYYLKTQYLPEEEDKLTYVGGREVSGKIQIRELDTVTVGKHILVRLELSAPERDSEKAELAKKTFDIKQTSWEFAVKQAKLKGLAEAGATQNHDKQSEVMSLNEEVKRLKGELQSHKLKSTVFIGILVALTLSLAAMRWLF